MAAGPPTEAIVAFRRGIGIDVVAGELAAGRPRCPHMVRWVRR